jgi:hypothetical protein
MAAWLSARWARPSISELGTDPRTRDGPKGSLLTAARRSLSSGDPPGGPPAATRQREKQHVQTRPHIRRNRTTREQKSRVGWLPTCAEAMLQKPVYQAGGAQPAAAQSRKAEVAVVGGGGGGRGAVWRWTGRRACKRHS